MQLKDLGEINLLKQIQGFQSVQGIGDDCAVLDYTDDKYLLVTTDMLVEGSHFTTEQFSWGDIGRKAVEVNLSDIAAMGGIPTSIFISLGLPGSMREADFKELYSGLSSSGIAITGGDLTEADKVVINICVLGVVEKNRVLRRSGAAIGDLLAVTGELGANAAGGYTLVPFARQAEGRLLAQSGAVTAMTDISDGLARSIYDIASESKAGIRLEESKVPLAKGATLKNALNGGEDYELLFTFKAGAKIPVEATVIGEVVAEGEGTTFDRKGFEHYRL
ncbi:MAG: thiamine-phosphate kinase [Candidatus Margulisiibacteriota bacterium]